MNSQAAWRRVYFDRAWPFLPVISAQADIQTSPQRTVAAFSPPAHAQPISTAPGPARFPLSFRSLAHGRCADSPPTQRIVKVRRDYNSWVAGDVEDYALRFTRAVFVWSVWRVAQTAFGGGVVFGVGGDWRDHAGAGGVRQCVLGDSATGLIIALAGWPISVYAARFGVDMDLLLRAPGLVISARPLLQLIYASFTFYLSVPEAEMSRWR